MSHPPRWNEGYESDERRRERRRNEDSRFDRDRGERERFEAQRGRGRPDDDEFEAQSGFAERDRWDLYEEWQQPRRMGGYFESQRFGSQGGFPADPGSRSFQQRERSNQPQDWQRAQRYPAYEGQRFGGGFGEQEQNRGFAGRGPKNYKRSDQRIQEDICDRLTSDPSVDASEIQVEVKNGEVTLEGSVSERSMKRRAEDTVEDVSGVSQVHNRLRVGGQQQAHGQSPQGAEASWARAGSEQQRADQPGSSQSRSGRIA